MYIISFSASFRAKAAVATPTRSVSFLGFFYVFCISEIKPDDKRSSRTIDYLLVLLTIVLMFLFSHLNRAALVLGSCPSYRSPAAGQVVGESSQNWVFSFPSFLRFFACVLLFAQLKSASAHQVLEHRGEPAAVITPPSPPVTPSQRFYNYTF